MLRRKGCRRRWPCGCLAGRRAAERVGLRGELGVGDLTEEIEDGNVCEVAVLQEVAAPFDVAAELARFEGAKLIRGRIQRPEKHYTISRRKSREQPRIMQRIQNSQYSRLKTRIKSPQKHRHKHRFSSTKQNSTTSQQ